MLASTPTSLPSLVRDRHGDRRSRGSGGVVVCQARVHAATPRRSSSASPSRNPAGSPAERPGAQLLIALDVTAAPAGVIGLPRFCGAGGARERPLDRAAMHPHPEPLGDQLDQIAADAAPGRPRAAHARTRRPRRSACAPAAGPAAPAPAPASPPASSAAARLIERRAREPERVRGAARPARRRPAPGAPSRTSPAPDPARRGTPRRRTPSRTASGRGFKLRSARNACTFGSSPCDVPSAPPGIRTTTV